jgi:sulfate permease, SulP family
VPDVDPFGCPRPGPPNATRPSEPMLSTGVTTFRSGGGAPSMPVRRVAMDQAGPTVISSDVTHRLAPDHRGGMGMDDEPGRPTSGPPSEPPSGPPSGPVGPEPTRSRPWLGGILPIERSRIGADVLAGLTLAAVAAPECMGYATIAGMPVVTGLYTLLLPVVAFALLGASRHLVVAADSATAAILFAGLSGLGLARLSPGSPRWVALAGLTAIMAGVLLLVARLLRLGFLANFLSRTVLVGFLAGVGVQVAISQVPDMLGLHVHAPSTIDKLTGTGRHLTDIHAASLAVALGVLAVLVVGERVIPRVPAGLIAVVGAIVVSWVADLPAHGVAIVGPVPRGLPSLGVPHVDHTVLVSLLPIALSIFVIVLAQSAATSAVFAALHGEEVDTNADLVGLGVANLAAGLSGTFMVNGSPTKTGVVDQAGGRSQLAQLTTAATVVLVLVALTKPLSWLPQAALAAVVFRIAIGLIDVRTLRRIAEVRIDEFIVAALTAATVVVLGVEQGIILAVAASIVVHVRRDYEPFDALLVPADDGSIDTEPVAPGDESAPGLIVYRFGAGLFYANSSRFVHEIRALVAHAPHPVRCVIVDASALSDVDYTAGFVVGELENRLRQRGVALAFAHMDERVRAQLDRYQTLPIGPSGQAPFYERVHEAIDAFRRGEIPVPAALPPAAPPSGGRRRRPKGLPAAGTADGDEAWPGGRDGSAQPDDP